MASLMPSSLGQESPVSKASFVLSLWRMRSMGLRLWKTDMGGGESRGHALHQSLHLHPAASQLSVFLDGAELAQSKMPRTHFGGSTP